MAEVRTTRAPRAAHKPFHLFVYGTLMQPTVFRAVLGYRMARHPSEAGSPDTFLAREAVLSGYKKISPDETYLYAVPDPQGKIRGYVVGPLPGECMAALLRYEGRNYRRVRVKVEAGDGAVAALAFVANLDALSHAFGWEFRDHLKQEVLLREKINKVIAEDEAARLGTSDPVNRRALLELHGLTIRDLVRRHFEAGGISTYAIRKAIRDEPLREFGDIPNDPLAAGMSAGYLTLLARQVLFNQVEDRIREEFRYELDRMQVPEKFYERTISALAALRWLNDQAGLLHLLAGDRQLEMPFGRHRLIEYVRRSIQVADAVFEPDAVRRQLQDIQAHMGRGAIPLGAELEFSNIGHAVISDPLGRDVRDPAYDGFLYFRDFGLDILTWKLGGHVDDHRVKSSPERRRGFFELAFGSLSVEADISKPITDDPWLLNQMIQAATRFYGIAPHSLHISLQLGSGHRPVQRRLLPLGTMKCLFALAGGARVTPAGAVRLTRLASEEIIRAAPQTHMLFSQVSRRRSSEEGDLGGGAGHWVQQYKFLRLSPGTDYEPLILALKGVQLRYRPGTFMTAGQFRANLALRQLFTELVRWGQSAQPLSQDDVEEFLTAVHDGLVREHRGRPAHSLAYIGHCLARLRAGMDEFNRLFGTRGGAPPARAAGRG